MLRGRHSATDNVSRRSTSGDVVTHGGRVLGCGANCFSAIIAKTRSLEIQSELLDRRSSCAVDVASGSHSGGVEVHTTVNPEDVCANALLGDRIWDPWAHFVLWFRQDSDLREAQTCNSGGPWP